MLQSVTEQARSHPPDLSAILLLTKLAQMAECQCLQACLAAALQRIQLLQEQHGRRCKSHST